VIFSRHGFSKKVKKHRGNWRDLREVTILTRLRCYGVSAVARCTLANPQKASGKEGE